MGSAFPNEDKICSASILLGLAAPLFPDICISGGSYLAFSHSSGEINKIQLAVLHDPQSKYLGLDGL